MAARCLLAGDRAPVLRSVTSGSATTTAAWAVTPITTPGQNTGSVGEPRICRVWGLPSVASDQGGDWRCGP